MIFTIECAYLINAELFPTILLATAYGCCNIFGRLIAIASPIVANFEYPNPLLTLIILAIVSAIHALLLKKDRKS
jgi:hypothetical protein